MIEPLAWNPALGRCKGPYNPTWASQQPLLELFFAAGIDTSRKALRRLAKQGGLAMQWWPLPSDAETAALFAKYPPRELMAAYCVEASAYLTNKELIVWQPLLPVELEMVHPLTEGVVVVKRGRSLTRIALSAKGRV